MGFQPPPVGPDLHGPSRQTAAEGCEQPDAYSFYGLGIGFCTVGYSEE